MTIFTSRTRGETEATQATVTTYLMENYYLPNGDDLRRMDAERLIKAHPAMIDEAVRTGSFAYFVGDEIAKVEDLQWIDEDEKPFPDDE